MACKIIATFVAALLVVSCEAAAKKCDTLPCPLPDICNSRDACIAWCINEGYATGVCYGDANRTCICERPCADEASELPAPMEPTGA